MMPEDLLERLLYRDALMLVIDKPAGMPVHAGSKGGSSLESLFGALRFGLPVVPRLAHRLDRATSGCLVLGRHRKALAHLGKLFESGVVEKTYWAVVVGAPPASAGTIEAPLARRDADPRSWWMRVDPAGQSARTDYQVLGTADGLAWLRLSPRTGRTHQIRVHCAALGCPVLGDTVYGSGDGATPLHLHARAVAVPLYPNRAAVAVTAPVPEHMAERLAACGWRDERDGA
ncbi:MAG: RNA pseudouridine synthase [Alphaproteobacteria bacterium]